MKVITKFFAILVILLESSVSVLWSQSINIYVDGSLEQTGKGTKDEPYFTIKEGLDKASKLKIEQGHFIDSVYIWLRAGTYKIGEPITLDNKLSGLPGAPLVISAMPGEKISLSGGVEISPNLFTRVSDKSILRRLVPEARNSILVADLKKAGIFEFDEHKSRGLNIPEEPYPMELFCNDTLMQIARWPNEGYDRYGKVIDEGSIPRYRGMTLAPGAVPVDPMNPPERYAKYINDTTNRPGNLHYISSRPDRWKEADDLWMFGWWKEPWASQTLKVKYINTKNKEIGFEQPHHYGLADNGLYFAFNLLEEIDRPGEYFIDRKNGLLYFWPTFPIIQSRLIVSLNTKPIIYLNNASNIILRNLTIEVARGNGIVMEGGSNNLIENCIIRNIAITGIEIKNGITECRNHQVKSSEFYFIRGTALNLGGGNRAKLIPAGNCALNNHFHHEAEVSIQGVGNRFAHNVVHNNPYGALNWSGNDHLIEYNEFYNCLSDGDDASVLYTGRNPSGQGNIIRFNYFHHNTGRPDLVTGTSGVYLDDGTTGQIIYGNIFYKTGRSARARFGAIFLHGAKDNFIANNLFIDCPIAIGFGPWEQERWEKFLLSGDMKKTLYNDVNINDSLFSLRYPVLQRLKYNASVNHIKNNFVVSCDEFLSFPKNRFVEQNSFQNLETTDTSYFIDYENEIFELKIDSDFKSIMPDFQIIPVKNIGN